VVLLYPSGKVSRMQEQQLTTLGGNVTALEVLGTFDDCQRMVKAAFGEPELRSRLALTSANSINIARLLPQTFYYAHAWAQLGAEAVPPIFAVPSGNFGNLTAGLIAQRMGLPVERFVAATNVNDVVPEYLDSGVFAARPSRQTLSSAMDVGDPSNFARMLALYDGSRERMARDIRGYHYDDAETLAGMRELHDRYGYLADPHTAVGYLGLMQYRQDSGDSGDSGNSGDSGDSGGTRPGIVLATAHPAKFAEVWREELGEEITLPERLRACLARPKQATQMPPTDEALRTLLLGLGA
jgi:threonine synthase